MYERKKYSVGQTVYVFEWDNRHASGRKEIIGKITEATVTKVGRLYVTAKVRYSEERYNISTGLADSYRKKQLYVSLEEIREMLDFQKDLSVVQYAVRQGFWYLDEPTLDRKAIEPEDIRSLAAIFEKYIDRENPEIYRSKSFEFDDCKLTKRGE